MHPHAAPAPSPCHITFIEPLEARIAPATFNVTSPLDSGANTMRQAILDANATPGADTINFNSITVLLTSALPEITEKVFIVGSGSTGSVIDGRNAGAGGVDGLVFSGPMHNSSTVSDIGIVGFSGDGLVLANQGGNVLTRVRAGTSGSDMNARIGGNGIVVQGLSNELTNCFVDACNGHGIFLVGTNADENTIKESSIGFGAQRINGAGIVIGEGNANIIKENSVVNCDSSGIVILGSAASGNFIRDNLVGVKNLESQPVGNALAGIFLGSGANTVTGNYVIGNGTHGIQVQGGLGGANDINGNIFSGSGGNGVLVETGGGAVIQFNQIGGNNGDGVRVTGTGRATIFENLIVVNGGLPIDLGGDGPTANDVGTPPDTDSGPNDLQNRPVVVEAIVLSGSAYVRGELRSTPSSTFTIDLVTVGEGEFGGPAYGAIGQQTVTTDASGFATFVVPAEPVDGVKAVPGDRFLLTATTSTGLRATSEMTEGEFEVGDELVRIFGLTKATWIDVDGDKVTLTVTKGALDYDAFQTLPSGNGTLVKSIEFGSDFNRASVKITVAKVRGGDGLVTIGTIDASEINLDTITIKGSLNGLNVGRAGTTQSLEALIVNSLGNGSDLPRSTFTIDQNVRRIAVSGAVVDSTFRIGGRVQELFSVKSNFVDSALNADRLTAMTVGGDLRAEKLASGVFVKRTIGTITITGDLAGDGMARIAISAGGVDFPANNERANAFRSLSVGGDVVNADILAGFLLPSFGITPVAVNPDVRIGSISVRGDFTASSVSAGVDAGMDNAFATTDDALVPGGSTDIISRIASVTIGGAVTGNSGARFGFTAEEIGSVRIGGTLLTLTAGKDDIAVPGDATVHVREV